MVVGVESAIEAASVFAARRGALSEFRVAALRLAGTGDVSGVRANRRFERVSAETASTVAGGAAGNKDIAAHFRTS